MIQLLRKWKKMITKNILDLFVGRKNILILPHILPDGDTLGSSLALDEALKSIGHKPYIILDDDIPTNLNFITENKILSTKSFHSLNIKPDMIITIDSSDVDRIGKRIDLFTLTDEIINIDHHKTNSNFAKYNLVNKDASACGEIIYNLINDLSIKFTKEMATCLYVALSTDTGSFKYSNTTSRTLRIAADLLDMNINQAYITTELYQNKNINKINLLKDILNTLEIYYDGRLSIMYLTLDMLKRNSVDPSDTDGLIEYARDIEGVEVGVLLKELSLNEVKIGLRSKYDLDVSQIAKLFNGGGHKNASGCTLNGNINDAKRTILDVLKNKF